MILYLGLFHSFEPRETALSRQFKCIVLKCGWHIATCWTRFNSNSKARSNTLFVRNPFVLVKVCLILSDDPEYHRIFAALDELDHSDLKALFKEKHFRVILITHTIVDNR